MTTDAPQRWTLPVVLPVVLIAVILGADALEGPKTAYVGVLAVIPMLSAVFGTPKQVAGVSVVAWLSALAFGLAASDGNVPAQRVRLVIIALSGIGAVLAARQRQRSEERLLVAERDAAFAEQMRRQADTDPLTGALNRRGLLRSLGLDDDPGADPGAGPDRNVPWTVAVLDLDDFKLVNDRFGHQVGDEFLRAVYRRLDRALAERDLVGRWGGDEFLLVLNVSVDRAEPVLRRVQDLLTRMPIETSSGPMPAEASVGAAGWVPGESFDAVLRRADHALYEGKGSGGGRLIIDVQQPDPSAPVDPS